MVDRTEEPDVVELTSRLLAPGGYDEGLRRIRDGIRHAETLVAMGADAGAVENALRLPHEIDRSIVAIFESRHPVPNRILDALRVERSRIDTLKAASLRR